MKLVIPSVAEFASAEKNNLSPAGLPRVGEPFHPARLRENTGGRVYPPAIVGRQRGIKDGPKRLYGLLYSRAGENDTCWLAFDSLAYDLGKSERQIRSDMARLEGLRLIRHEWRHGRRSNTYVYLWHEWFDRQSTASTMEGKNRFKRQSTAGQLSGNLPHTAGRERQSTANLSGSPLPTNSLSELSYGNLSSSSTEPTVTVSGTQAQRPTQLDMMTENNPEKRDQRGKYTPQQAELAGDLLKAAHKGRGPTSEETKAILGAFRDFQHFRDWLNELCQQRRNLRLTSYGGYLTDAQRWADQVGENEINLPLWTGFYFECAKCVDGGIVEVAGKAEWCECQPGRRNAWHWARATWRNSTGRNERPKRS